MAVGVFKEMNRVVNGLRCRGMNRGSESLSTICLARQKIAKLRRKTVPRKFP